jgi:hypothetical protein
MRPVERITDAAKVQKELDVYKALFPQAGELSATVIEIEDAAETSSCSTGSKASTSAARLDAGRPGVRGARIFRGVALRRGEG